MRKFSQKQRSMDWLTVRLADGPVRSDIIRSEGDKLGFSYSTLLRAATALDILSDSRNDFIRRTFWSLPDE